MIRTGRIELVMYLNGAEIGRQAAYWQTSGHYAFNLRVTSGQMHQASHLAVWVAEPLVITDDLWVFTRLRVEINGNNLQGGPVCFRFAADEDLQPTDALRCYVPAYRDEAACTFHVTIRGLGSGEPK